MLRIAYVKRLTRAATGIAGPRALCVRVVFVVVTYGSYPWLAAGVLASGQNQPPAATFRSSVDLVRLTAVVRDRKGRFVQDLSARDFEVLDDGRPRSITDFRRDVAGVSVALLFDVSGSMESQLSHAGEAAEHVLSWLMPDNDAA